MPSYQIDGLTPVVDPSAYVHPTAVLIGDVIIGPGCYVGPCASLRGDFGRIVLEAGSNVQDSCVLHSFPNHEMVVETNGHIGHGAVLHGCSVRRDALVGMNAVVMDRVVVGENSIIGALCFVPEGMQIPERKIVVGNPAKIIKEMSDEMIAWKSKGTDLYRSLPDELRATLKPCEPLREVPVNRPDQQAIYSTWMQTKKTDESGK